MVSLSLSLSLLLLLLLVLVLVSLLVLLLLVGWLVVVVVVHYYACMVSANPLPHSSDCMLVSVLPQLLVVGVCWAVAFETHGVSVACVSCFRFSSFAIWE